VADDVECRGAEPAGHGLAAGRAALLIREDDELERMACRDARVAQEFRHLDCAKDAHVAVVVAALRHRVDVRSRHDHRQRRVRSGAAADDVPGGVDAHFEPGVMHQRLHVRPARDVGFAERDAAHAALGIGAEAAELVDAPFEASGIGWRQRIVGRRDRRGSGRRKAEECRQPEHGANPPGIL
jgi:hypothetical protein